MCLLVLRGYEPGYAWRQQSARKLPRDVLTRAWIGGSHEQHA
jgi:hypothetical protein